MDSVVLSDSQLQAMRVNKVELGLLQRRINIMNNNLQHNLEMIQQESKELKFHYHNVVRIVKSSRPRSLWENPYAYETESSETKNTLESLKLQELKKTKPREHQPLSKENSSDSFLPLLLSVKNHTENSTEQIVDYSEIFRSKLPQVNDTAPNNHHRKSKLKIINEYSNKPTNIRPVIRDKPKLSNPNGLLRRQKPENSTAKKSIEQIRMEACRSFDNELASKHQTLKRTMRLTGVVK